MPARTTTNATVSTTISQREHAEKTSTRADVGIIGLGYVGLPLAILAKERGYAIRGFDIDATKVEEINRGTASFLAEEEVKALQGKRIDASTDETVLRNADIYVICVPTPVHEQGEPDLGPLMSACKTVGPYVRPGSLVIVESTVSPGVCETVALKIIEKESGLKGESDFFFAHCPERINPGDAQWNVRTIPRVIGGLGPESLARATAFYESVVDGPVRPMGSIKEAEAVKMVENAFRDVNIAFVNELAMSFGKAGINIVNVLDGAATKPFGFMRFSPSCGVGGHCIPVDPYYLIRYGRENGFEHRFLVVAREINSDMPAYTVGLLRDALAERGRELVDADIALLGLSYKRDIPDLRESPSLEILKALEEEGAFVRVYDPHVPEKSNVPSLADALHGVDAAIVATDHSSFCTLTPKDFLAEGVEVVIDGRNCLPKKAFLDAGIVYRGIGR